MEGFIMFGLVALPDASIGIASVAEEENNGNDGNEFPNSPLPDASVALPDASVALPDASVEENNEKDSTDDENKSFILVVPCLFKNVDLIQYL